MEKLYEEQEAKKHPATNTGFSSAAGIQGIDELAEKTAIATLYPESSIFFADLVGFTKWSSTRTPVEVFKLLETFYGAFDEIALRRRVFKVETIGDCYVSVLADIVAWLGHS